MLTVIVDTTVTFVDLMMKKTRWMQLLTLCHNSEVQVIVPEPVLRETARHWEAETLKAIEIANGKIAGLKNSRERLSELGIDASGLTESTPVTTTPDRTTYEEQQTDKLVSLGVQVMQVPGHVDIETVLRRDLDRKKPFETSGKGFRDALVWETAKDVVMASEVGDKVYFVTGNSRDYCDSTGALAAELVAEVEAAEGELIRVEDLDSLFELPEFASMVAGLHKSDDELAMFLADASSALSTPGGPLPVSEVVKNAVMHAIEQLAGETVELGHDEPSDLDFSALAIPTELQEAWIDVVEPDESTLNWQTYETYNDTTLLVEAEIQADISLLGFVYRSDAVYLEEEGSAYILDFDWNDHMAHIGTTTTARLIFQIQLEQGMSVAEACELESVAPIISTAPGSH